jgi:hypothetical protein
MKDCLPGIDFQPLVPETGFDECLFHLTLVCG